MAVPHRKIGSEAGRALLERLNPGQLLRAIENPSPPVYVCGNAKTLIPSLPVSPEAQLRFGVAGHPQRQRFEQSGVNSSRAVISSRSANTLR